MYVHAVYLQKVMFLELLLGLYSLNTIVLVIVRMSNDIIKQEVNKQILFSKWQRWGGIKNTYASSYSFLKTLGMYWLFFLWIALFIIFFMLCLLVLFKYAENKALIINQPRVAKTGIIWLHLFTLIRTLGKHILVLCISSKSTLGVTHVGEKIKASIDHQSKWFNTRNRESYTLFHSPSVWTSCSSVLTTTVTHPPDGAAEKCCQGKDQSFFLVKH